MGYAERSGVWSHPGRQAIFVGDFIDRGPHQLETLDIVRPMVAEGYARAVLGNHEFNAIAWFTEDPARPGHHLRTHFDEKGEKNRRQHVAFLNEVQYKPEVHRDIVNWFYTLPLWLDLPELRVVHACWHPTYMAELEPRLQPGQKLDQSMVIAASRQHSPEYHAVEALTKGLEIPLPKGRSFFDKDKVKREEVRVRWWDSSATTFRQAALLPEETSRTLPNAPIPPATAIGYPTDKPIFFGHYWMTGTPRVLAPKIACVDYSAGHEGPLVAYRWEGESILQDSHFIAST